MRLSAIMFWVCAALLIVALGLTFAMPLLYWSFQYDALLGIAWLAAGYSILGYVLAIVREGGRMSWLAGIGMACGAASLLALAGSIWTHRVDADLSEMLVMIGVPLIVVAVSFGLAGLLMMQRIRAFWARCVRGFALVVIVLLASDILLLFMGSMQRFERHSFFFVVDAELLGRSAGILAIVLVCSIVALAAHLYMRRLTAGDLSDPNIERRPLRITCPRCGTRQQLVTEGDNCRACGLGIAVRVA